MSIVDFKTPPVVEAGIAVYFESVPFLNNINLTARAFELVSAFGFKMPNLEQTLYIEMRDETEVPKSVQNFSFSQGVQKTGIRITSSDGTSRLDIQDNRFGYTWVQQNDCDYPRYEELKNTFVEKFNIFCNGVPTLGVISPKITQAGIQYVNLLDDDNGNAYELLNLIDLESFRNHEAIHFYTRQRLTEKEEIGRLYLAFDTVTNFENTKSGDLEQKRKLKFALTFRGKPKENGIDGLANFIDRGRESIVNTFSMSLSEKGRAEFGQES